MSDFAEYRHVGVADPLRQGDVLESTNSSAPRWDRHLLVITADCDFANAKHHGRVTCVPLLDADEYLMSMQLPRLREKLIRKPLDSLEKSIGRSAHLTVSRTRLREWALEEDPYVIVRSLGIIPVEAANEALLALRAICLIDAPASDLETAVSALIEAQLSGPNPPKRENAQKAVIQPLCDVHSRPPGDAFFLSSVGPGCSDGYFGYLRHVTQVSENDIATKPLHRSALYRRIARLEDRFIHAIAQQFGMVFMAIGLPREYEELRDLHSNVMEGRFQ